MDKQTELDKIKQMMGDCRKCEELCKNRHHIVFGEGNPDADIVIVGEGPGEEEDCTGRPFVGRAGSLLDNLLESGRIDRQHDVYITNTICCRATMVNVDEKTKKRVIENRPPTKEERLACRARLMETIYIIDPMMIIAMGKPALLTLTGKNTPITKIHGEVQTIHLAGRYTEIRYPVLPVYHPAYLLRNYDRSSTGPWAQIACDIQGMLQIVDYLREKYYGVVPPDREIHGQEENRQANQRR